MKKIIFSILTLLLAWGGAIANDQTDAASALACRILPNHGEEIVFVCDAGASEDYYSLQSIENCIVITGNNVNSMAVGLNNYLRDFCKISVTWNAADAVKEPYELPMLDRKITRKALVGRRFFLNYCTFGYTLAWWQWKDWERLIDWMALNGVNLALANTGQEAVWQKVWMKFGLTAQQTREYFTGPGYLAWHRMSNIDMWHGPLPQSWIDNQAELQKLIVARELEVGINPVLTSFNGHVPAALKALFPAADIKPLSDWGTYERRTGETRYKCSYLNPSDPLYNIIQKEFLKTQKEMFGQDCHIYGIDPFNEVAPPCWDAEYLADAGRRTYETLAQNDPDAVWLQMGWLFYYDKRWTPELVKAYISPVPKGKLIMIDYFCEKAEVYRRTESFYGQDFIWSYLGNFGGNTMISGDLHDIDSKLDRAYAEAGSGMTGVGCTLEGLGVDPPVFEYVLDRAWEKTSTVQEWMTALADRHAGFEDEFNRMCWQTMLDKCQKQIAGTRGMTATVRPKMDGTNNWRNHGCCYDNHDLLKAWGYLSASRKSNTPSYRFDCVNIARQCLENYFSDLYQIILFSYRSGNREHVKVTGDLMLQVLDDLDLICGADPYFLLGKWIDNARTWGVSPEEKDYLEQDARMLITCWAFRGAGLNDYANRAYNGLISTYYRPRWEKFVKSLLDSMDGKSEFVYKDFVQWCQSYEWKWATGENSPEEFSVDVPGAYAAGAAHPFASGPKGNPVKISRDLYLKYKDIISAAPGTSGIGNLGGPNINSGI